MSRPFSMECGCCGHVVTFRKFEVPDDWRLIKGAEDVALCQDCVKKAEASCEHKVEKHVEGMYVQCQACGRLRYLVNL